MARRHWLLTFVMLFVGTASGQAEILRWDTGAVIPGTEGITPGPGVELRLWNEESRNLRYADLATNLTGADFGGSWLENAKFANANLTNTKLNHTTLSDADFNDAIIRGAKLHDSGITYAQLAATKSFKTKDLRGVSLAHNDMTGWDLSGQDLSGAQLSYLVDANLSGANLTRVGFDSFSLLVNLTRTNFSGAIVERTFFGPYSTKFGFTQEQLKSTASYQNKNLRGIRLWENDLTGWDFSGQDLTDAQFIKSTLRDANLDGAQVSGVNFGDTTRFGFTQAQLASTASYKAKNLAGVDLAQNNLSGWNLSGQTLIGASFGNSIMPNVNLQGADLTNTYFFGSTVTQANFSGAKLANGDFEFANDFAKATFSSATTYNQNTKFPRGFNPVTKGLTLIVSPDGDFHANDSLDIADLELLQNESLYRINPYWLRDLLDLNDDNVRDQKDVTLWVKDLKKTWFGDANLDGQFNSDDLIVVFQAGHFEDDVLDNSTWSTGDWNTDGEFTTSDLVLAFQDGGYEAGPRAAVAVPEPMNTAWLILAGLLGPIGSRCRRRARER